MSSNWQDVGLCELARKLNQFDSDNLRGTNYYGSNPYEATQYLTIEKEIIMEKLRLNQVIAVEKNIKNRTQQNITVAYHKSQKPVLFNGFSKTYQPLKEENEKFPPENKLVEVKVTTLLKDVQNNLAELFDIEATKDYANCNAKADVTIDGVVLVSQAPATYLLFLEKQLTDLANSVKTLPVLDATEEWTFDTNSLTYKTIATQTIKTKKVQEALVLIPPTDKHPGQAVQVTNDINVGNWNNVKMSGAISEPDKQALTLRVESLIKAVKFARETANLTEAPEVNVSDKLLGWLFAK